MNERLTTPDDDNPDGEGEDLGDLADMGDAEDPGTDSDPDLAGTPLPMGVPIAAAIPEARPIAEEAVPPAEAAPARPVPAHYTLLAAATFLAASGRAVWQRTEIFGSAEVSGAHSITVTMLLGLALYGVAATIGNIATARLPRARLALLLALAGLALTVRGVLLTVRQFNWLAWGDFKQRLLDTTGYNFKLLSQGWLGQFAPGLYLAALGSLLALVAAVRLRKAARDAGAREPGGSKESYRLLFGASFVVASGLAVWERGAIFDGRVEVTGLDSVSVSLLFGFGLYSFVVGIANIVSGRIVPGMLAALVTGGCGLWFGIRGFLATWAQERCLGWDEVGTVVGDDGMVAQTSQWLGQFAPGPWAATLGGLVITLVFLKAIVAGGGAKKTTPAPTSRRRSR